MRTRRTDILVGITVAVTLLAAGCGGGGSKAATGSPNGVNPGVELPAIQVQHQSAFALLDAAGWSAALGDGVTAIEDDLMAPDSSCGGSISGASTLTAGDIKIVIVLYACDSEADAQSLASAIGSPAPQVTVQQCTQLLNVRPELGPESQQVLNHIKENGGDPTVAAKEANATLAAAGTKLADALKAKLSCDPGKSVFEIPAGGADPCDSASLSAAVGEAVTFVHEILLAGPGVSCQVRPKTKTAFTMTLTCDAQLKKAVPPTESNAAFATAAHNAGSQAKSVNEEGVEAFETRAFFQAKLRPNGTVCVLKIETGGSTIEPADHAVFIAVAAGLNPRFVDKDTFFTEGGSSAVAN